MQYKTILIDDEPLAISRLKRMLGGFEDTFDIIAEAQNGQQAQTLIEELKPDLIFLDIEMPLMNGFELLDILTYMPMVIFCTAYDQYAIKAFEENSIDYLLKPVEKERLAKTVDKLQNLGIKAEVDTQHTMAALLKQLAPKKEMHSITVKSGDKILFIPLSEISFFQAEDKYVFLNTTDGKQYLTSYTLSTLEEKLPDEFVRVSRSATVRLGAIMSLEKSFNGKYVILLNDQKKSKVESGSSYSSSIKNLLEL